MNLWSLALKVEWQMSKLKMVSQKAIEIAVTIGTATTPIIAIAIIMRVPTMTRMNLGRLNRRENYQLRIMKTITIKAMQVKKIAL